MMYTLYEMNRAAMQPLRWAAMVQNQFMNGAGAALAETPLGRNAKAAADLMERVTRRYGKPDWYLPTTRVRAIDVPVTPTNVWSSPWCNLVHFDRDPALLDKANGALHDEPRVLIVAPLSGHYATLLRGTVEAFLPDHEVYITDWADARNVPLAAGRFDLSDYVDHVRDMIRHVGPGAHIVAVCQPGPAVLAAISLMSEDKDPALPATMTFMGSPIDARRSPTVPNLLAEERPFEWFENNMIYTVPLPYAGAMRRVYPGFVQLASFMNMNWERHVDAHWGFFQHLVDGDGDNAQKHREFYDEYLAVLDLTEEFYLDTIRDVFQEYKLPRGLWVHKDGRTVRPDLITDVALMTVEGENDDISGIGQTQAAHDICSGIPAEMRIDLVQEGVGHYGVFNGRRFRTEIQPRMREFMRAFAKDGMARKATGKSMRRRTDAA
jgi:poly(3-hydroxybutyrate) depolymerase